MKLFKFKTFHGIKALIAHATFRSLPHYFCSLPILLSIASSSASPPRLTLANWWPSNWKDPTTSHGPTKWFLFWRQTTWWFSWMVLSLALPSMFWMLKGKLLLPLVQILCFGLRKINLFFLGLMPLSLSRRKWCLPLLVSQVLWKSGIHFPAGLLLIRRPRSLIFSANFKVCIKVPSLAQITLKLPSNFLPNWPLLDNQ